MEARRNVLALGLLFALAGCGGGGSSAAPAPPPPPPPPAPVQLIEFSGQSNSGQGGIGVTLDSSASFPNVLQFAGAGKASLGFVAQPASDLTGFVPAFDDPAGTGQYVETMAGFAIADSAPGADFIVHTDWYGNQPISSFLPGTTNFANTMQALGAAKTLTAAQGRAVECPWYVWIQGENGADGRAAYAAQLAAYVDSIRPAVAQATGQATQPTFVIVQTNSWDSAAVYGYDVKWPDGNALGQWDVARTKAGVIMAGPMYQAPLISTTTDGIHATAIGRMMIGDMLAAVHDAGASWKPLQPNAAVRTGNQIDITFDVPAGALAWDTAWIKSAPNYGFTFRDDAGSANVASVALLSANTVRVTLDAVPTGANMVIRYGVGVADNDLDGWATGRGQLISPTTRASYFYRQGYPVPQFVNHYSVKFELPLQ